MVLNDGVGGALVVWPGMPFPNLDGRIHQSPVLWISDCLPISPLSFQTSQRILLGIHLHLLCNTPPGGLVGSALDPRYRACPSPLLRRQVRPEVESQTRTPCSPSATASRQWEYGQVCPNISPTLEYGQVCPNISPTLEYGQVCPNISPTLEYG